MERKERRSRKERTGNVRRKINDPNYKGPGGRSGMDRRSRKDRRVSE